MLQASIDGRPPPVSGLFVLQLASSAAEWLSQRQTLVAGNIANASTPGFRAKDLQPFTSILDNSPVQLAVTQPGHIAPSAVETAVARPVEADGADETLSGNTVSLEREMSAVGDINRAYTMNVNIKHVLNQMLLAASK
jgi:flagellar basal-body rod protein FlgB